MADFEIPRDNSLSARLKGSLFLFLFAVAHLFWPQKVYHKLAELGHFMWQTIQHNRKDDE